MKRTILSFVSILALSGISYAGENTDIVDIDVIEIPTADESAFYVGVGVSGATVHNDNNAEEITATAVVLQAGYQYNRYIAIEGRYNIGVDTSYDAGTLVPAPTYSGDFSSGGVYLKPIYPIGDFAIYGLVGYGGVMLTNLAGGDAVVDGLQYGAGVSYQVTETISVFADYTSLYDDKGFDYTATLDNITADIWTVGLSYKF